ncbi:MAG TPA: hypothetical protein PLX30_03200 [Methanothrix sp.]|mgnify:FL=1|nr:hypothetical protein [Methanothrix sp.]
MGFTRKRIAISLLVSFVLLCFCAYPASSNAENESRAYKIVDRATISIETWIYIFGSLFLGLSALVAPVLAEELKRKRFAPKLEIAFELSPPFCHKTIEYTSVRSWRHVFYFRFGVVNKGKSQAKKCEVVLEDFWNCNEADKPIKYKNISAVNMNWSKTKNTFPHHDEFIDINPNLTCYCNLCHVNGPVYDDINEMIYQEYRRLEGKDDVVPFVLDANEILFSQQNSFPPGKYEIQLGLYSENAGHQKICFEISWSGKWQENEWEVFKEMVIRRK